MTRQRVFPTILLGGTMLTTVLGGGAAASTIEVRPGQSIEAAIKRARPGDTVAVRAGTYHESVYSHASGVKIISADGKGAAHIVSPGTALFIQGGSGNEIRGFRVTAGPGGNGIQVGGSRSAVASGYVVADNIVTNAGLDGIKVHQAKGFNFTGNTIENAGTGNKGNADGGIDFVAVTDSTLEGNTIRRTGGNSCLMLKGGTARNTITGNSFGGCKEAIHVGGYVRDGGETPGFQEAYDNKITGNSLCGREKAFRLFPGEARRQDNSLGGNAINDGCATSASETGDSISGSNGTEWLEDAVDEMVDRGMSRRRIADELRDSGLHLEPRAVDALINGTVEPDTKTARDLTRALRAGGIGAVKRKLLQKGYIAAEDVVTDAGADVLMDAVEIAGLDGGKCSSTVMNAVTSAGGALLDSIFGGGRATRAAQFAQQIQLVWANKCAAERNEIQKRQYEEQRRMTAGIGSNAAEDVGEIEWETRAPLGSMDADLYGDNPADALDRRYHSGLPEEWTFETAAEHTHAMREQTNLATREAAVTAAMSNRAVGNALTISNEALELSQGAEGQTSAIQAQTQMLRAGIAVNVAKHASDTASATAALRMEEERRAAEIIAEQKLERFYGPGTLDANAPPRRSVFN